ncbi:competence/damage-inducible protein A [Pediococcus acidilactici]
MKAEIISVGTEILLGEITDTNSVYLSQQLAQLGIDVYHQETVGDNSSTMKETLSIASKRSDLVITIGGLGPTEDDITKQTLAEFLGDDLVVDSDALAKVHEHFTKQGRPITPNNERQALLLKGSRPVQNPNGLAIGLFASTANTDYLVLPGPPSEFKPMVNQEVLPLLKERYTLNKTIQSKTLHFVGVGEADLATRVADVINQQTNPTIALYFKPTDVTIRLTAKADSKDEAEQMLEKTKTEILARAGDYYYAEGDQVAFPDFVVQALINRKLTLTAAESLTGGAFQSQLVETAGTSTVFSGGFVTYSDEVKTKLLGVRPETIAQDSVVSRSAAEEMARGAQKQMGTDLAISFTGVAGPEELEGHAPGDVWIGLALPDGSTVAKGFHFSGNRKKIRYLAVMNGFRLIWEQVVK